MCISATEIDYCGLSISVDDKMNTIYGYFVASRSGSNDLRYEPRGVTDINTSKSYIGKLLT